jgi:hypothetical protein
VLGALTAPRREFKNSTECIPEVGSAVMSRAAGIRESSRASSWKDLLSFRWRDSRRAYLKRG